MKFTLKAVCKSISVNPVDNGFSILDIFEEVKSNIFPFLFQSFNVIYQTIKDKSESSEIPVVVEIKNNDKKIGEVNAVLVYDKNTNRNRFVVTVPSLVVEQPGELSFTMYYNNRKKHEKISVIISKMETPA